MAITGTAAAIRPEADHTRATSWADRRDRADAAPLGVRRVFAQVAHDLYGTKDVQDAITATYVWMADQIGHLTLGFVPTILLCWIASLLWADTSFARNDWRFLIDGALAAVVFGYWVYKELTDLADTTARAAGTFPLDSGDIVWNVKTALLYFGVGGLLGLTAFIRWYWVLVALAVVLWPSLAVAFWWLRRKLAFQQAGLPYLFRLANFASALEKPLVDTVSALANLKNRKTSFWRVLVFLDPLPHGDPPIRHLLISGPLGAGKTSLCVGMGTEFAFALGRGRYLSATKLVELVIGGDGTDDGDRTYEDGLILWNWRSCDLLIVDDVDAGARSPAFQAETRSTRLVDPDTLVAALTGGGQSPLAVFAGRRTVWVLGDTRDVPAWRTAIAGLLQVAESAIGLVELTGSVAAPLPPPETPGEPHRMRLHRRILRASGRLIT